MKIYRFLWLLLLAVSSFAQTHTEDTLEDNQTIIGNKQFAGQLGIYNDNGIFWAGSQQTPGTPTITASEASANATGVCRFDIAPTSSSAEPATLVTNSMGYKVYESPSKCFAYDNRQNVTFGTAPMYPELVMGYNAGELTAVGINLWAQTFGNPIPDSTTAGSNFLWIGGPTTATKLPAAGGDQIALAGVVNTTDKADNNGSPSSLIGVDGEANLNNTTMTGTFTAAFGGAFGAHITRAASTAHVTTAGAIHAFGFGNTSSSGGGADAIYTILVEQPGTALAGGEAYSIYSHGNMLFDQNGSIWAHPSGSGGVAAEHIRFAGTGVGFVQNLFSTTAGGVGLGLNSLPFGFLTLGNSANLSYQFLPVNPAANRAINLRDAGAATTLGVSYNGGSSVYQTKRAVAGCTTGASIGGTCGTDITVTWGTAFADANYSVACIGNTPTNVPTPPFIVSGTKLAATVHVNYFALTAAAASYASVDCEGIHD